MLLTLLLTLRLLPTISVSAECEFDGSWVEGMNPFEIIIEAGGDDDDDDDDQEDDDDDEGDEMLPSITTPFPFDAVTHERIARVAETFFDVPLVVGAALATEVVVAEMKKKNATSILPLEKRDRVDD